MKVKPEVLKAHLEKAGKGIPEIAKETGISERKVREALEKETDFTYKELHRIAKALGIPSWLLIADEYDYEPEKERTILVSYVASGGFYGHLEIRVIPPTSVKEITEVVKRETGHENVVILCISDITELVR